MVERLQDICSFVIDLDIKYKEDLSERQYTDETIDKLCKFFFQIAEELFELNESQFQVLLMEKPNIRSILDDNTYKSGWYSFYEPYIHVKNFSKI